MTARRCQIGMFVLVLAVSFATPSLAASPPTQRELDETFRFSWAGQIIKDADPSVSSVEGDRQWMAYVEQELNAAKQELLELEDAHRALLVLYGDQRERCEREVIDRWYNEELSRLQGNIRALRDIRGDRRRLFTKAWHRIGPAGRRVVRAIGDEALTALGSGGLGGGVARRILVRVGRNELKNAVLAGIGRKIQAQAAAAKGAAEDECKKDVVSADPGADPGPNEPSVIPAATYVGALDPAIVTDLLSFDSGRPSVNRFTLIVDEDGLVSGRFEVHQEGSFLGCPGRVADWAADVSAGQYIGAKLPADLTLDLDVRDHNVWEHDVGCFDPVPENYFGTGTLRIRKADGDRLLGVIEGVIPFELERVAEE